MLEIMFLIDLIYFICTYANHWYVFINLCLWSMFLQVFGDLGENQNN